MLKRPNLFTCGTGFQIKIALSQVDSSISKANKHLQAIIAQQLSFVREATNLLVMDKSMMTDFEMVKQVFPHLNVMQINHMLKNFKTDEFAPDQIPYSVIEKYSKSVDTHRGGSMQLALDTSTSALGKMNLFYEPESTVVAEKKKKKKPTKNKKHKSDSDESSNDDSASDSS